ncbi:MAG: hypothetical protein ACE5IQ_07565 [Candidatus Methylomirabilales bacterium]
MTRNHWRPAPAHTEIHPQYPLVFAEVTVLAFELASAVRLRRRFALFVVRRCEGR